MNTRAGGKDISRLGILVTMCTKAACSEAWQHREGYGSHVTVTSCTDSHPAAMTKDTEVVCWEVAQGNQSVSIDLQSFGTHSTRETISKH